MYASGALDGLDDLLLLQGGSAQRGGEGLWRGGVPSGKDCGWMRGRRAAGRRRRAGPAARACVPSTCPGTTGSCDPRHRHRSKHAGRGHAREPQLLLPRFGRVHVRKPAPPVSEGAARSTREREGVGDIRGTSRGPIDQLLQQFDGTDVIRVNGDGALHDVRVCGPRERRAAVEDERRAPCWM